mgnify:FL=1
MVSLPLHQLMRLFEARIFQSDDILIMQDNKSKILAHSINFSNLFYPIALDILILIKFYWFISSFFEFIPIIQDLRYSLVLYGATGEKLKKVADHEQQGNK